AVDDAGGRGALAERPVALVVVERVPAELVRDVEVGPAVAVVIGPRAREVPPRVTDAGPARHVDERAVAAIAVEGVPDAVHRAVVRLRDARLLVAHADDVEIEEPVTVVVGRDRHAAPAPGRDAGRGGHVLEAAAARVVEE